MALGILDSIYTKGIFYKRAGIMVSDISSADSIQPDLFHYNPERAENTGTYPRPSTR